jgi:hypothetical protein
MVRAGIHERLLDRVAVDRDRGLLGVLLDDREQVAEQPPLGLGQLGALDRPVLLGVADLVDRPARAADQRRQRAAVALLARLLAARRTAAQAAFRRGVALLRYRLPSSYLRLYSL